MVIARGVLSGQPNKRCRLWIASCLVFSLTKTVNRGVLEFGNKAYVIYGIPSLLGQNCIQIGSASREPLEESIKLSGVFSISRSS